MTPEEKAQYIWMQLFQKQIDVTGNGDGNLCVEMALIAVDEIIKASPSLPILGDNGTYSEDIELSTNYWQKVKQEISNL